MLNFTIFFPIFQFHGKKDCLQFYGFFFQQQQQQQTNNSMLQQQLSQRPGGDNPTLKGLLNHPPQGITFKKFQTKKLVK